MSKFWQYVKAIFKHSFSGVFLLLDILSAYSPFAPLVPDKYPIPDSLDWRTAVVSYSVILLCGMYLAWSDKVNDLVQKQAKIDDLLNKIPEYSITVGKIVTYSASSFVATALAERDAAEQAYQQSLSTPANPWSSLINITSIMSGQESPQHKRDRLANFYTDAKQFDEWLKNRYLVELFIESSRADGSVEASTTSSNGVKFAIGDRYLKDQAPAEYDPGTWPFSAGAILNNSSASDRSFKCAVLDHGKTAYTEIGHLNARRKHGLFDENFFIITAHNLVDLKLKIHSNARNDAQELDLTVDLNTAQIKQWQ